MKKVLLALTVLGSATCANAVTVDDLMQDGGWGVEIIRSQDALYNQNWISGGIKFERVPGHPDKIELTGFMDEDGEAFIFTLKGDKLCLPNNSASTINSRYTIRPMYHHGYSDYSFINGDWEGTITATSDGYQIEFPHFGFLSNGNIKHNYADLGPLQHIYNGLTITTFKPNVIVTDDVYDNTGYILLKQRTYRARFDTANMTVLNFSNDGYALTSNGTPQEVTIDYYKDGDFGIPRQASVRGPLFADSQSTQFVGWLNYEYVDWAWYCGKSDHWDIYGTPYQHLGHVDNHNHWAHHTRGGTLSTILSDAIPFDDYVTWNESRDFTNFVVKNTVFHWIEQDITTKVELDVDNYGSDSSYGVYLSGTIKPTVYNNSDYGINMAEYIDHYELHLVNGVHNTVKGKETNQFNGLPNGKSIHAEDFDSEWAPKSNKVASFGGDGEIKFNKLIKPDQLPGGFNFNNGLTLFVKTVYNDPNLTPSFHALTPMQFVTTGIGEVLNPESTVSIYSTVGTIIVEGAEGAVVEVYNTAGVQVYAGTDSSIAVEAGLYIVKVGTKAQKVIVR